MQKGARLTAAMPTNMPLLSVPSSCACRIIPELYTSLSVVEPFVQCPHS